MTPGEVQGSIEEICEGIAKNRRERILMQGGGLGTTKRPFVITFPPDDVCSDSQAIEILEAVRARNPDLKINGTRTRVRR